jgi:hypothetical protein
VEPTMDLVSRPTGFSWGANHIGSTLRPASRAPNHSTLPPWAQPRHSQVQLRCVLRWDLLFIIPVRPTWRAPLRPTLGSGY